MSASTDALHFARPRSAQFTGRWFFVGVATLFILMALAGFVPTSIAKLGAVHAGQRPPLPPVLHVHAAMMGAWLLLLLGQAVLATTGRRVWHRRLGYAGAVLLPAIIVTGVLLLIATWQMVWGPAAAAAMPPGRARGNEDLPRQHPVRADPRAGDLHGFHRLGTAVAPKRSGGPTSG